MFGGTQCERSPQSPQDEDIDRLKAGKKNWQKHIKILKEQEEMEEPLFASLSTALDYSCQPLTHGCCIIDVPALIRSLI